MSITLQYGPAQARLILDPTDYQTGGTDLGLIGSAHVSGYTVDTLTFTTPYQGTTLTDARIMGVNWLYNITLIEYSTDWLKLLTRGTNTADTIQSWDGYNLGHLVGDSQTHSLLIRPVDDAGAVDVDKPFLYIPRAFTLGAYSKTWDRTIGHVELVSLTFAALLHDDFDLPAFYGEEDQLPAILGGD